MLAELGLSPQDWASVLPAIATAPNLTSLERLRSRADGVARSPLEVRNGFTPTRLVLRVFSLATDCCKARAIDQAHANQIIGINELQAILDAMRKDVKVSSQRAVRTQS